jgi:hypothetical protein
MALFIRKMGEIEEVNAFLRAGIVGGFNLAKAGKIYELDGKTIVLTTPAVTVTFATTPSAPQVGLTFKEILAQINAASAGLARAMNGRLHLELPVPGPLVCTGGTALAQLGFDPTGFTTVLVAAPGGAAPTLEFLQTTSLNDGSYILGINEP